MKYVNTVLLVWTIASASSVLCAIEGQQNARPLIFDSGRSDGFSQIAPSVAGIDFEGAKSRTEYDTTLYIENGGVAAGDIDGDGLIDLFFCGLEEPSRLYLNKGDWKFENGTEGFPGGFSEKYINAAVFADGDGDGDLDLFCGSIMGDSVYLINDGSGKFSYSNGVDWERSSIGGVTSFALADVDQDGDLDLYTSRYLKTIARDYKSHEEVDLIIAPEIQKLREGKMPSREFAARYSVVSDDSSGSLKLNVFENGLHDVLYINNGKGRFEADYERFRDANGKALATPHEDWGLTASFRDVDGDGDQDLYVCNDFNSPDRFWLNNGNGYFSPVDNLALRRTSNSSMGVDFADINNDGHQDMFVVDMLSRSHALRKRQMGEMVATTTSIGEIDNRPQIMQNTLFLNRGDNTWTEIAQYAGVKASEWSWSPAFLDVDLDGFEDILVTTGAVRDFLDADKVAMFREQGHLGPKEFRERQRLLPRLPMRNFIFRNRGDLTFEDQSEEWGFSEASVSGGLALADFDLDGDLDAVVNNTDSLPEIYRNDARKDRIAVRLKGPNGNQQAIGSRIRLMSGERLVGTRDVISGGSYASGSDTLKVFSVPTVAGLLSLAVEWASGEMSYLDEVSPNYEYTVYYEEVSREIRQEDPVEKEVLFEDVSELVVHVHQEAPFDDFSRQPLLPNRLSQLGPGLSWVDLDDDGDDELIVPSGRGGHLTLFANLGNDDFRPLRSIEAKVDQTMALGFPAGGGNLSLLLGMSTYEDQINPPGLPVRFDKGIGWSIGDPFPASLDATGPLAQSDIDGDGDLDLFMGGRVIPGQYPRAASSRIFLNVKGKYEYSESLSEGFQEVGLVSGATFGDLDGDGDSDLVLACEWGPVRVFINEEGRYADSTESLGLASITGWWNGVALGDLNNDGVLEIVATNWGRNSKYEGSYGGKKGPLQIYFGDVDGNGVKDIIEAHYDTEMACIVPERGFSCSTRAMPFVGDKMKTFQSFGLASLQDIYGDLLNKTESLEAVTLEHTVFFREGDSYGAVALPVESQFSTAFGICIGDMDGDGNDDLFLSQNFFSTQVETPRNDGGRGLLLLGDGRGNLEPVKGQESGLKIYGDQRGAALSDFDGDGRVDLAVAQNGSSVKLYRNVGAKKGLRLRLKGPRENPSGVGALVRLLFSDSQGPARSISSGSGYWSQESSTHVFGMPSWPKTVWVQWPDGRQLSYDVPESEKGKNDLAVDIDGALIFENYSK